MSLTVLRWFCCAALLCSASAFAEPNFSLQEGESLPRSAHSERVHAEIEEVLSSDDFARKKTVTRWRIKDIEDKETRDESFPEWVIDLVEFFEATDGFFSALAKVLEVLLWMLVIGLIVYLLVRFREPLVGLLSGLKPTEQAPDLPTTMFGLDVQKDSLPEDVVASARELWLQGESRQSVAVLLRASLIALLHDHGCRFSDSDTESECCERIEHQAPSHFASYMWKLVRVWQQLAYAHREPSQGQFDELCTQWQEVF